MTPAWLLLKEKPDLTILSYKNKSEVYDICRPSQCSTLTNPTTQETFISLFSSRGECDFYHECHVKHFGKENVWLSYAGHLQCLSFVKAQGTVCELQNLNTWEFFTPVEDSASAGFETGRQCCRSLKEALTGGQNKCKVGDEKGMINPVISFCQPE